MKQSLLDNDEIEKFGFQKWQSTNFYICIRCPTYLCHGKAELRQHIYTNWWHSSWLIIFWEVSGRNRVIYLYKMLIGVVCFVGSCRQLLKSLALVNAFTLLLVNPFTLNNKFPINLGELETYHFYQNRVFLMFKVAFSLISNIN